MISLLLACGQPAPSVGTDPGLRAWVEGVGAASGELVVQVEAPASESVEHGEPAVEGLAFEELRAPTVELLGEDVIITRRYRFTGTSGHYEIPSLTARWAETEVHSEPVWVDLGVEAPREVELADIAEPPRIWTVPWRVILVGVGLLGTVSLGIYLAFRVTRRGEAVELPPEPPDVAALRAWDRVRRDPALDDLARSLALSQIFREYTEVVLAFPATAWTSTEVLARLTGMQHLPEGNIPRARRLLGATDRVKFAGERGTEQLFEDLDSDLRGFVGSTRPRAWAEEASP